MPASVRLSVVIRSRKFHYPQQDFKPGHHIEGHYTMAYFPCGVQPITPNEGGICICQQEIC